MEWSSRIVGVWITGFVITGGVLIIANVPLGQPWSEQNVLLVRVGAVIVLLGIAGLLFEAWGAIRARGRSPGAVAVPNTGGAVPSPTLSEFDRERSHLLRAIDTATTGLLDPEREQWVAHSVLPGLEAQARAFAVRYDDGAILRFFDQAPTEINATLPPRPDSVDHLGWEHAHRIRWVVLHVPDGGDRPG